MKILEIKNNLVKISYNAADNLELSGFVIIEDNISPYVAQVMSLKADSGINYAIVKLLFTFDTEGVVKNYNGTIPALDASITKLSAEELLDILPIETPFMVGKLAQQDFILNIDYSVFEKNLLICSDKAENTDILLSNIAKRMTENNDKSIIFDTTGTIEADNKLVFGKDFKLPLNYDTINFIYEHDLNDVDAQSKAIIQDVLLEVQEYSKTLLDQFIPFDIFTAVIDAQAKALQLPELTLLKSRLEKYKNEQIFAQDAKDFQELRAAVRGNLSTLVDISPVDSELQNLVISTVYKELADLGLFMYSLVKINNENADKRLMKKLITDKKISTTIVAPHNYKYIHDLKELAGNMVFFAPQTMQHDFASYNVFLSKLNPNEAVIVGKTTQNIPLIIEVLPLEVLADYKKKNDVENINVQNVEEDVFSEESNTFSQDDMISDTPVSEEDSQEAAVEQEDFSEFSEENQDISIEPSEEEVTPDSENLFNQENYETDEEDIVITNNENSYTEDIDESNSEFFAEPAIETTEEDVISEEVPQNMTEADLDFIDNLNETSDENSLPIEEDANLQEDISIDEEPYSLEQQQETFIETPEVIEPTDNILIEDPLPVEEEYLTDGEQTPVVPVYPVEEASPVAGNIADTFAPGDKVSHSKYGEGVVEKMVKFGDKILCSINFASGRRLLDPTISQLIKE